MLEGDVHASQKAWKEAIAAYRAGLKVAPDSTDVAVKLYTALGVSGAGADAEKFSAQWTKDHPKDVSFRRYLADVSLARRDFAGALGQYRTILAGRAQQRDGPEQCRVDRRAIEGPEGDGIRRAGEQAGA